MSAPGLDGPGSLGSVAREGKKRPEDESAVRSVGGSPAPGGPAAPQAEEGEHCEHAGVCWDTASTELLALHVPRCLGWEKGGSAMVGPVLTLAAFFEGWKPGSSPPQADRAGEELLGGI